MSEELEIDLRVFIIAEIGVNHDGKIDKAKQLILGAKVAGANAVKFQSYKAQELASSATPKVPYQLIGDKSPTHQSMLKKLELSHENQKELYEFSKSNGITFMSTPYSLDEARFLNSLGVSAFKVASADIVDLPLHDYIASTSKVAIVSTGMASEKEISEVVSIYKKNKSKLILMHCTSEYPTPIDHAFMKRIKRIGELSGGIIGFSDHTVDNLAAVMSVAMGCRVIEKHITINKEDDGPDHAASLNLAEFTEYCTEIRRAELALGDGSFERTPQESLMAATSRKSLHLTKMLHRGEILKEEHLVLMRPGSGLFWSQRNDIIGKHAQYDMNKLHLIAREDFA
jgi:N,N'-diacetyllegionaminate synthase